MAPLCGHQVTWHGTELRVRAAFPNFWGLLLVQGSRPGSPDMVCQAGTPMALECFERAPGGSLGCAPEMGQLLGSFRFFYNYVERVKQGRGGEVDT